MLFTVQNSLCSIVYNFAVLLISTLITTITTTMLYTVQNSLCSIVYNFAVLLISTLITTISTTTIAITCTT